MRFSTLAATLAFAFVPTFVACGDPSGGANDDAAVTPDAAPLVDAPDAPVGPAAAHYLVVSHPYDAAGNRSPVYEVLAVDMAGTPTQFTPPRFFSMARASYGVIAFTPDGKYGFVALEDGNLGEFRLSPDGIPTVLQAEYDGAFYAERVVMDPSGDHLWVIDSNTRENGGGVYRVDIGADGALTDRGKLVAAKSPGGFALVGTKAVLAAKAVLATSVAGDDVHLLDFTVPTAPTLVDGADGFTDDAIFGGAALSASGTVFMVGDNSGFSTTPNSIGVFTVSATAVTLATTVANVEDPEGIAIAPAGDRAIVTSAFGNAIFVLDNGGANGAWRKVGKLAYRNGDPQLPGDLAALSAGPLAGHAYVSELSSIRHVHFTADAAVDVGAVSFGADPDDLTLIGGAIGITP